MSTENENVEKEVTESDDDSFEVLDMESEQEHDDSKYSSRNDLHNAGTIIFCHMNDEYKSFKDVSCTYIRPEGWKEQDNDELAIFEVGWINTDEAVAKLPFDRNIQPGFPLGYVDMTGFAFCKEEQYATCPGAVSHFQACYLREGLLLGASTPFGIRGIKAVNSFSPMGEKPLFFPSGDITADGGTSTADSFKQPNHNYSSTDNLSCQLFKRQSEMSPVNIPPLNCTPDKLDAENESVHVKSTSAEVELSALQSSLRNLTALTRKLQNRSHDDKSYTAGLILELTQSVDELSAEMQKAKGVLPSNKSMITTVSSPESYEELEQRFLSYAEQLKANLQNCTRTFDLCKNAIKNQTPPSSLSEMERSDFLLETEWKRQQEMEELRKQLKNAEEERQKLREQVSSKESERRDLSEQLKNATTQNDEMHSMNEAMQEELSANLGEVEKRLYDKETELKEIKEELSMKESETVKLKDRLDEVLTKLRIVSEELAQKELDYQELEELNKDLKSRREELERNLRDAKESASGREQDMKCQYQIAMNKLREKTELMSKERTEAQSVECNLRAETDSERKWMEAKLAAESEESAVFKSQITTLLDEVKLYKVKLGETILELRKSRRETDDLKAQCKYVERVNFLEADRIRLIECIETLEEKLENKRPDPAADERHDVLVQEFLKKSEELNLAKQQVDYFQEELSRLNVQRTNLQKELFEARNKSAACDKPCCTFEITPGTQQPDHVVKSILEALEQSFQENKRLQSELEMEKKRSQTLEEKLHTVDEKLQSAAGKHRSLFMEKMTLESKMKELLGSD